MKTAVLISGQLRTFATCFPTQRWQIFRHYNCEFFVTVQDNEDCASLDLLRKNYGKERVHVDLRTDPVLEVTPKIESAWNEAPYANAAPPHQLLLQHWYGRENWNFFLGHDSPDFNTFIRIRGDLWIHSFQKPDHPADDVALTPWFAKFGSGVNDRLAVMGRKAAEAYFSVYDHVQPLLKQGCPFHPETLVGATLEMNGCIIRRDLQTEFSTIRKEGPHRPPEITTWDIAHAALRS